MTDKHRKQHVFWKDHETNALIAIWWDYVDELRQSKRNRHVYIKIQNRLVDRHAITHTLFEIKTKIDNLTKLYRKEKQKMASGGSPSNWKHFHQVDVILSSLPRQTHDALFPESTTNHNEAISVMGADQGQDIMTVSVSPLRDSDDGLTAVTSPEPNEQEQAQQHIAKESVSPTHSGYDGPTDQCASEARSDSEASGVFSLRHTAKRRKITNSQQLINFAQTMLDRECTLANAVLQNNRTSQKILQDLNELQRQSIQINSVMLELMQKFVGTCSKN